MIYKDCDNKEPVVTILKRMLALAGPDKSGLIERQLRTLRAGIMNERETAYLIDFHLRDATRTAVVHDLRLDLGEGRVAQIDHLLVGRARRFHLLETKLFARPLKIGDEGEFLRWNSFKKTYEAIPSPLAQNAVRAQVLRAALEGLGLDDCRIDTWVLVAPDARIERPRRFDTAQVIKADQFIERLRKWQDAGPLLEGPGGLLRTGLYDSVAGLAQKLVSLHRLSTADYMARFGIVHGLRPAPAALPTPPAGAASAAPQVLADDSMRST